jgi:hypothetical protein
VARGEDEGLHGVKGAESITWDDYAGSSSEDSGSGSESAGEFGAEAEAVAPGPGSAPGSLAAPRTPPRKPRAAESPVSDGDDEFATLAASWRKSTLTRFELESPMTSPMGRAGSFRK